VDAPEPRPRFPSASVQKAQPPLLIPSLCAGLAAPKPLPLTPTQPGARFPELDSTALRRKLPRSCRAPPSPVSSARALWASPLWVPHPPPPLFPPPSSSRSVPRPSASTVRSSPPPAAVAPRLLRRLHVAPPLRHSLAAISTLGGCAVPWRCSRCAPHRMYAAGEPSPLTPPRGPQLR
jgi:hypothetical protein